jgi:hypothetical protein
VAAVEANERAQKAYSSRLSPAERRLLRYVHPCPQYGAGQWCWSDPNDAIFNYDMPSPSMEEALEHAVQYAKEGFAFKAAQKSASAASQATGECEQHPEDEVCQAK